MNFIKKYFIFCAVVSIVGLTIVFAYEPIKTYLQDKKANEEVNNYKKASQNYQEACKELDFEAARELLSELRQEYITTPDYDLTSREKAENKYFEAFDYIYKAEIQFLLSEFDDEECRDKITFLLEEIPIIGEKAPAGLCNKSAINKVERNGYLVWVEHYNRLCNTILTLAINRNYPKLAKVALMQFADNMEITEGGTHYYEWPNGDTGNVDDYKKVDGVTVDQYHAYVKYVGTDRDAAKKKYDEAVKLGVISK